jgi:membrane associated rhomboid family serine protease
MKNKLTWSFIIVNVLAFELIFSMPKELFDQAFALLSFSMPHALELWRWLTSLFMHADASHLFFNMLALYFFGRVLEEEAGARQWLLVYFLSGLAGNLVYGLTSSVPAVGASGCIFGLMGAAMLLKPGETSRLFVIPLPLGFIAIIYILSQVALSAMLAPGIAYAAHVGGLIAGSALIFYFRPDRAMKSLLVMLVLVCLLLFLGPIVGLAVGIGELVLSVIDFAVGRVLYTLAKLLFSWVWLII